MKSNLNPEAPAFVPGRQFYTTMESRHNLEGTSTSARSFNFNPEAPSFVPEAKLHQTVSEATRAAASSVSKTPFKFNPEAPCFIPGARSHQTIEMIQATRAAASSPPAIKFKFNPEASCFVPSAKAHQTTEMIKAPRATTSSVPKTSFKFDPETPCFVPGAEAHQTIEEVKAAEAAASSFPATTSTLNSEAPYVVPGVKPHQTASLNYVTPLALSILRKLKPEARTCVPGSHSHAVEITTLRAPATQQPHNAFITDELPESNDDKSTTVVISETTSTVPEMESAVTPESTKLAEDRPELDVQNQVNAAADETFVTEELSSEQAAYPEVLPTASPTSLASDDMLNGEADLAEHELKGDLQPNMESLASMPDGTAETESDSTTAAEIGKEDGAPQFHQTSDGGHFLEAKTDSLDAADHETISTTVLEPHAANHSPAKPVLLTSNIPQLSPFKLPYITRYDAQQEEIPMTQSNKISPVLTDVSLQLKPKSPSPDNSPDSQLTASSKHTPGGSAHKKKKSGAQSTEAFFKHSKVNENDSAEGTADPFGSSTLKPPHRPAYRPHGYSLYREGIKHRDAGSISKRDLQLMYRDGRPENGALTMTNLAEYAKDSSDDEIESVSSFEDIAKNLPQIHELKGSESIPNSVDHAFVISKNDKGKGKANKVKHTDNDPSLIDFDDLEDRTRECVCLDADNLAFKDVPEQQNDPLPDKLIGPGSPPYSKNQLLGDLVAETSSTVSKDLQQSLELNNTDLNGLFDDHEVIIPSSDKGKGKASQTTHTEKGTKLIDLNDYDNQTKRIYSDENNASIQSVLKKYDEQISDKTVVLRSPPRPEDQELSSTVAENSAASSKIRTLEDWEDSDDEADKRHEARLRSQGLRRSADFVRKCSERRRASRRAASEPINPVLNSIEEEQEKPIKKSLKFMTNYMGIAGVEDSPPSQPPRAIHVSRRRPKSTSTQYGTFDRSASSPAKLETPPIIITPAIPQGKAFESHPSDDTSPWRKATRGAVLRKEPMICEMNKHRDSDQWTVSRRSSLHPYDAQFPSNGERYTPGSFYVTDSAAGVAEYEDAKYNEAEQSNVYLYETESVGLVHYADGSTAPVESVFEDVASEEDEEGLDSSLQSTAPLLPDQEERDTLKRAKNGERRSCVSRVKELLTKALREDEEIRVSRSKVRPSDGSQESSENDLENAITVKKQRSCVANVKKGLKKVKACMSKKVNRLAGHGGFAV